MNPYLTNSYATKSNTFVGDANKEKQFLLKTAAANFDLAKERNNSMFNSFDSISAVGSQKEFVDEAKKEALQQEKVWDEEGDWENKANDVVELNKNLVNKFELKEIQKNAKKFQSQLKELEDKEIPAHLRKKFTSLYFQENPSFITDEEGNRSINSFKNLEIPDFKDVQKSLNETLKNLEKEEFIKKVGDSYVVNMGIPEYNHLAVGQEIKEEDVFNIAMQTMENDDEIKSYLNFKAEVETANFIENKKRNNENLSIIDIANQSIKIQQKDTEDFRKKLIEKYGENPSKLQQQQFLSDYSRNMYNKIVEKEQKILEEKQQDPSFNTEKYLSTKLKNINLIKIKKDFAENSSDIFGFEGITLKDYRIDTEELNNEDNGSLEKEPLDFSFSEILFSTDNLLGVNYNPFDAKFKSLTEVKEQKEILKNEIQDIKILQSKINNGELEGQDLENAKVKVNNFGLGEKEKKIKELQEKESFINENINNLNNKTINAKFTKNENVKSIDDINSEIIHRVKTGLISPIHGNVSEDNVIKHIYDIFLEKGIIKEENFSDSNIFTNKYREINNYLQNNPDIINNNLNVIEEEIQKEHLKILSDKKENNGITQELQRYVNYDKIKKENILGQDLLSISINTEESSTNARRAITPLTQALTAIENKLSNKNNFQLFKDINGNFINENLEGFDLNAEIKTKVNAIPSPIDGMPAISVTYSQEAENDNPVKEKQLLIPLNPKSNEDRVLINELISGVKKANNLFSENKEAIGDDERIAQREFIKIIDAFEGRTTKMLNLGLETKSINDNPVSEEFYGELHFFDKTNIDGKDVIFTYKEDVIDGETGKPVNIGVLAYDNSWINNDGRVKIDPATGKEYNPFYTDINKVIDNEGNIKENYTLKTYDNSSSLLNDISLDHHLSKFESTNVNSQILKLKVPNYKNYEEQNVGDNNKDNIDKNISKSSKTYTDTSYKSISNIIGEDYQNYISKNVKAPYFNPKDTDKFKSLLIDNNLVITGGSDNDDVDIKERISKNSNHFKGKSIDVLRNPQAIKLFSDFQKNPEYFKEKYGIISISPNKNKGELYKIHFHINFE